MKSPNNKSQPTHYKNHQQTVLVSNPTSQQISSDHPLFYVRQKNYFLQQLSNKVSTQNKFNQMDLKRNVRIDHFIDKHKKINQNIELEQKRRKMYLNSNDFQPIVGVSQAQKKRKQQERQNQKLRQQLYENYINQINIHEAPEKDNGSNSTKHQQEFKEFELIRQNEALQNYTVISDYRSDPKRKKQLYLLDLEINKLKQQELIEKEVKDKHQRCTNNNFLGKISNSIMSSYTVYFDEIYDLLIDQILEEEVIYLNGLEAGYHINGPQQSLSSNKKKSKELDPVAERKACKMMELVKQLDELAWD